MNRQRMIIGTLGVLLGLFGVYRLLTQIDNADLILLAVWLIAAVALHDGVLAPIVVGLGWVLRRVIPERARRHVQGGLIVAGLITVIALPMIHREGTLPDSKGVLRQDYSKNLTIALTLVLVAAVLAYVANLLVDRRAPPTRPRPDRGHDDDLVGSQRPSARNDLPSADHVSTSE